MRALEMKMGHHPCCNIPQSAYPGRVRPEDATTCNCDEMWKWEGEVCDAIGVIADRHGGDLTGVNIFGDPGFLEAEYGKKPS